MEYPLRGLGLAVLALPAAEVLNVGFLRRADIQILGLARRNFGKSLIKLQGEYQIFVTEASQYRNRRRSLSSDEVDVWKPITSVFVYFS